MTRFPSAALAAAAACLAASGASAQTAREDPVEAGKQEYMEVCAVCHGPEGKGAGPLSTYLSVEPPDVTQLAKNNDGHFPFSELYGIIAGDADVRAHGGAAMPVWGDHFTARAMAGGALNEAAAKSIARGRILSLVYYLQTIQVR